MPQQTPPIYSNEQIEDLIETTLCDSPEKKLFKLIFSKITSNSDQIITRNIVLKHPQNELDREIEPRDVLFGYTDFEGNQVIAYNVLMPEGINNNSQPYYQVYNPFNPFGNV